MKKAIGTPIALLIIFALSVAFTIKFSGPSLLRFYVESGMGTCEKIPILCMAPSESMKNPEIDKVFIQQLIPYKFPKMTISVPKGFAVVQETIKKIYYKKKKRPYTDKVVYILHQPPDFFVGLFPQLTHQGINSDYEFIRRTMHANLKQIKSIPDTFFVIMKGIFTPDLGEQKKVKMLQFQIGDKRGFINYNISNTFFDCNVIDENGGFFKIYIKDKDATLNIASVLAIITTAAAIN